MKYLAIVGAFFISLAGAGQAATGMSQMQYYVGSWSCSAGPVGQKPSKATATYTMDNGILRGAVFVPVQAGMKHPYSLTEDTIYDAKSNQFIMSSLDNTAAWSISTAKPWTGNTENWTDRANSGKLSHNITVRHSQTSFSFEGYPTTTSTKANFAGSCTRT